MDISNNRFGAKLNSQKKIIKKTNTTTMSNQHMPREWLIYICNIEAITSCNDCGRISVSMVLSMCFNREKLASQNPAVTKERRFRGPRAIALEEVSALSRAVTSEPIASGRSSASVDGYLSEVMSLLLLRRIKDGSSF